MLLVSAMRWNSAVVKSDELAESCANFFNQKIKSIINSTKKDQNVHNGTRKMQADNGMFMTKENI